MAEFLRLLMLTLTHGFLLFPCCLTHCFGVMMSKHIIVEVLGEKLLTWQPDWIGRGPTLSFKDMFPDT